MTSLCRSLLFRSDPSGISREWRSELSRSRGLRSRAGIGRRSSSSRNQFWKKGGREQVWLSFPNLNTCCPKEITSDSGIQFSFLKANSSVLQQVMTVSLPFPPRPHTVIIPNGTERIQTSPGRERLSPFPLLSTSSQGVQGALNTAGSQPKGENDQRNNVLGNPCLILL